MSDPNMIIMYGGVPQAPWSPRFPDTPAVPNPFTPPVVIGPQLVPCPTCKRHIYAGTPCPFCFAEQVAKAPSRAALEAVKKSLEEALRIVNEALAK